MLNDPWNPKWDKIDGTALSLQPLWQRKRSASAVVVRTTVVGKQLVFCLEWTEIPMAFVIENQGPFWTLARIGRRYLCRYWLCDEVR